MVFGMVWYGIFNYEGSGHQDPTTVDLPGDS